MRRAVRRAGWHVFLGALLLLALAALDACGGLGGPAGDRARKVQSGIIPAAGRVVEFLARVPK